MRKKDYARLKGRWPNALKEYRAKKGLTMQQLSEQAGLHNGAYHEYETGRIQPGATTAICLARVLDCTVEDIWGETKDQLSRRKSSRKNRKTSAGRREESA